MRQHILITGLIFFVIFAANATNAAELTARLADPAWDGKAIPLKDICKLSGASSPTSPRIEVDNIPAGSSKIIVAFNDESTPKLAADGGHGKISVAVPKDAKSIVVPPVPSESDVVPLGITVEAKHRSTTPGYYLAPCSRAHRHVYAVEITAVKAGLLGSDVTGRTRLQLGIY